MIYLGWSIFSLFLYIIFSIANDQFSLRFGNIVGMISSFIFAFVFAFIFQPYVSLYFASTWIVLAFFFGGNATLAYMFGTDSGQDRNKGLQVAGVGVALSLTVFLIGGIASIPLFHTDTYASLINVEHHGEKDNSLKLVSQEKALQVTTYLASKRSAEIIGSSDEAGLASRVGFGVYYGNIYKNEPYWIAPLKHSGFFTWLSNTKTPGYFLVNQTNINDAELVQDKPITTGYSGFYLNNINRVLYTAGFTAYQYGEPLFQVDDEGNPFYVVPLMRPQAIFGAKKPVRWAIIDASTREIETVDEIEDLPSWAERAYHMNYIYYAISNWGCYSQGFMNCVFSKIDVIDPTPGMNVTLSENGKDMIYYTGMQYAKKTGGASSNGATSGVMVIDTRTGKADFYRRSGITETAAQHIINGAVSNYEGWNASNPVLVNVNGLETYFSVILDSSGGRKGYGMVWQRNRNVYGTGSSINEALRDYLGSYRGNSGEKALDAGSAMDEIIFEGKVAIITPVVNNNKTSFYIRLENNNNKLFVYSPSQPAEVATTKVGEPVKLKVYNIEPAVIDVTSFENIILDLKESSIQKEVDIQNEKINEKMNIRD